MADEELIQNCIFTLKCPKKWLELETTSNESIRYCRACSSEVYLADDKESLAVLAELKKCVAIAVESVGLDKELFILGMVDFDPEVKDDTH